jgi:hypothetical protein
MATLAIAGALVAVGATLMATGLSAGIGWGVVLGGLAVGSRVFRDAGGRGRRRRRELHFT